MLKIARFLTLAVVALPACKEPVGSTQERLPSLQASAEWSLRSTIAFSSTRDDPTNPNPGLAAEIYVMDGDGTNLRRLTANADGDGFAALSPDGKKIVFDSNRRRAPGEAQNTSDLFVMNTDGSEQTWLIRGSSGTWSPDGKNIAFHASASGTGLPIKADPGAATFDSDIFVANVDDVLEHGAGRQNLTNSPEAIDDDPDWSPDGARLVYVSHAVTDNHLNPVTAEIYVINAGGTGGPSRVTSNAEEERAPSWSPDGSRIVFMCRRGGFDFELCVMNADGSGQLQLTDNTVLDATPTWSPDGSQIVFHRTVAGRPQLWLLNPDGTGQVQLTNTPGINLLANWGEVRVRGVHDDLLITSAAASSKLSSSERIVFSSDRDGNFELYAMNADGSALRRLTTRAAVDFGPAPSPDGTRIAFASDRDGDFEIVMLQAEGRGAKRLTQHGAMDVEPAWSPDGGRIAFRSSRGGNNGDIYVMNANGSGVTRLTDNPEIDLNPAWSPDGTKIAFESTRDGNAEIYVMNGDGSAVTRLTNHAALDAEPAWSPDGKKIAFKSDRDGNFEIYVVLVGPPGGPPLAEEADGMNADGAAVTRLTGDPGADSDPAWSPDGTRIAFVSTRDGNAEIYVMNADGSGVMRRTTSAARDLSPAWTGAR